MADAEIATLLREVRDLIAGLPAAIAAAIRQERAPRRLSPADVAEFARLLPIITGAACGQEFKFTMRQLWQHAELSIAPSIALREALETTDPVRLGKLLRRGADCGVEGYVITAVQGTRSGVKWHVARVVSGPRTDLARFASPRRVTVKSASCKI